VAVDDREASGAGPLRTLAHAEQGWSRGLFPCDIKETIITRSSLQVFLLDGVQLFGEQMIRLQRHESASSWIVARPTGRRCNQAIKIWDAHDESYVFLPPGLDLLRPRTAGHLDCLRGIVARNSRSRLCGIVPTGVSGIVAPELGHDHRAEQK
jgi:hypothetical protein